MDAKQFFEAVYGAGEGYAVLSLANSSGDYTSDTWFTYPSELEEMVNFVDKNKDKDVTFSPVLFSERRRIKVAAKSVSTAYADSDECPPEAYRVKPSITVQTAEGRTHNYWLLDGDYNPHTVALVNRRMHHAHRFEGTDGSFGHAAKLLRVPGTKNTKRGTDVAVVSNNTRIYSLVDIETAYPVDTQSPDKVYGVQRELPDKLPARVDLLNRLSDDPFTRRLLFDEPPEGRRSEMRYKLESELFRTGFEPEEVLVLVWDAPCCKYRQDGRPMQHLWEEILNAEVDPANQPSTELEQYAIEDGAPLVKLKSSVVKHDFLTDEERDSLYLTFVDEYEMWAKGRTTSHPKYHRMAALMIMSVVYSEYGRIPFDFEDTRLNLWMMLLGNTTVDKKTTAKNYMISFLESLSGDRFPDYDYDVGSDATQQGLNKYLGNKANQSSLLHIDEIQDVLREVFAQGFMSGIIGYWTELYSGRSRGQLRSTGDQQHIKSVPTNFQVFFMGITSHTADVLTLRNFESGFLTRFVYTIVEPRPYDPEADQFKMNSNKNYGDPVRDNLVDHIIVSRNYWSFKASRENPAPIAFDEEALARFNKFVVDTKKAGLLQPNSEILAAPIERLGVSVAKTAALFAMDDRKNVISIEHVLEAISFAEDWFFDLVKFSTMVGESLWENELNKLVHFLNSKGGKASYGAAYNQFSDKQPQDFRMMVDALDQRGIIRFSTVGGRALLEVVADAED